MASYTCPKICDVDHIHYTEDMECSFMEELVKREKTKEKDKIKTERNEKTYVHRGSKITVEWVKSYHPFVFFLFVSFFLSFVL